MEFITLSDEKRHKFEETGYLIVHNVLNPETIAELVAAGDRIFAENPEQKRQQKAQGVWDSYRNCLALDDAFIPLLTQPRILSYIIQLLGPNLHMMTSHLIYRFPDPSGTPSSFRPFGWHRDIAHMAEDLGYRATPRLMIKCAFYLTDLIEQDCGATLVLPGSNHLKTEPVIPSDQSDPDGTVEPHLAAGDCLLFENRTWHAVGANLHGLTRKTVMFGYGFRWLKPVDYVTQTSELVEKLSLFGKFLVGERLQSSRKFQIGGSVNPLKEWAEEHNFFYHPPSN
ncbi:MAG: phytanoyl-CoA dioxygenase family protein [Caldilineaceae bacterium]